MALNCCWLGAPPVETNTPFLSRLVDSITIFGEGIPHDFVEVGTNVEYALYVNDGHVQHKRFLPADKLRRRVYKFHRKRALPKERRVSSSSLKS